MKLRMNYGPWKRNHRLARPVEACHDQAVRRRVLERRRQPLSIPRNRTFAELRARHFRDAAIACPQAAAARDYDRAPIGMERGRVRMDWGAVRELARFPRRQYDREELRRARAVAGEEHFAIAWEEGALQKVGRVIDVRAVRNLPDHPIPK